MDAVKSGNGDCPNIGPIKVVARLALPLFYGRLKTVSEFDLSTPFQVRLYDLPSLFAGKLHALLFRSWKSRVKGRDFYDFIWYISRNVPVNLPHLQERIKQSGLQEIDELDMPTLQSLLKERFARVNIKAAAEEVRPFLRDPRELSLWSEKFFVELVEKGLRSK